MSAAPAETSTEKEPIAIVGMACIFPRAPDLAAYWRNILGKVDAVDDPPEDWCGDLFLDPASSDNDRVYTKRGGFLGNLARFDALRHGVMPNSVDGGEPDQFLALEVAADAVADAGFDQRPVPGDRVAVILGRGTYINRGFVNVVQHGVMIDRTLAILRQLHPETTDDELATIKARLKDSLPPFNPEMAPALVPNLVTGRISNRLDFRGTNYIIDAACASSLIALERGVADLKAGRCDMAIVGGVHASTPAPIYQIFCQLEALSRRGAIRPFSTEADGTLLAEGVGIICMKRLEDAEVAGDRIYALVRGVGVASDGRGLGMLAPRVEGERLALERAYAEAGVDPATVGLIEAHGTATPVGDATEIEALKGAFGDGAPRVALGSVKSMIGHCLPASGSAGLIKAAMALYQRVMPPTLIDTPNAELGIDGTPFYLNTETRPWIHGDAAPRRAGVNAFGFGGINAHAVLEEYTGAAEPQPLAERETEIVAFDAPDATAAPGRIAEVRARLKAADDFAAAAREITRSLGDGGCRMAVVGGDAGTAVENLGRIEAALTKGKGRLRDRRGAYLATEPLVAAGGKIAFMFPGEGSQHREMLGQLMLHAPEMRRWFDIVDGAYVGLRPVMPSQVVFPPPLAGGEGDALWRMDVGPEVIFAANQSVGALYDRIGLQADMFVGHSTGEYSALFAGGVTRRDTAGQLQSEIRALNGVYAEAEQAGSIAEGALIAVAAVDGERLAPALAELNDVHLAMDNCPSQQVVAAPPGVAARVEAIVAGLGGWSERLPFDRAYHCPLFQGFSEVLAGFLDGLDFRPPERPVYSCLTAAPFPEEPDEIRRLTAAQWAGRVRFTETIRAMHDAGARVFVECGPRNNLTAFTDEILRGRPHLAVAVDTPSRGGLAQLHHMAAQLLVEGVALDLSALAAPETGEDRSSRAQPLKMGLQPMSLGDGWQVEHETDRRQPAAVERPASGVAPVPPSAEAPPAAATRVVGGPPPLPEAAALEAPPPASLPESVSAEAIDPVISGYFDTMTKFVETERAVMNAFLAHQTVPAAPVPALAAAGEDRFPMLSAVERAEDGTRLAARIDIDLDRAPYLSDHCFGRATSVIDPTLHGLAVVPLTFSMEALAEVAAALRPAMVVIGFREVRASQWIALDRPVRSLEGTAEVIEEGATTRMRVRLREAEGPVLRPVIIEAEVELAAARPPAPPAAAAPQRAARPLDWTLAEIYSRIMFHGPRLQAVERMDVANDTWAEGELIGLSHDDLYAATRRPLFETDAITLDAVGQLVGVWSAEMLETAFHIFPFRVEIIEIFRGPLAPGERARCRCAIGLEGGDEMRTDIEVVTADGHLQCRIVGWWDKRFDLPPRFFAARLDPVRNSMAAQIESGPGFALSLIDELSDALLDGSGGIWTEVAAGLALARSEVAEWQGLRAAVPRRRWNWLRGRIAAKDAVRALRPGICPADVTVASDETGRPVVLGWPADWGAAPLVSITHTGEIALAASADAAIHAGIGIDAEFVKQRDDAFLESCLSAGERALLPGPGRERDRMATWAWCAKEATAKSFGLGLEGVLDRFEVVNLEAAGATKVEDRASGEILEARIREDLTDGLVLAVVLRFMPRDKV